jgi:hypothetical protein
MNPPNQKRVLALDVRRRSLGFVVLESPDNFLDWGVKSFRGGVNAVRIPLPQKLATLLSQFRPDLLVMKRPVAKGRRTTIGTVLRVAEKRRVPVQLVSPTSVRKTFRCPDRNKHEIATATAARSIEFADLLPAKRRPWESEHYRMSMFDAAALGLTYFDRQRRHAVRKKALPERSHRLRHVRSVAR